MGCIEWNSDFSIGNTDIDLQHMELINIYNALVAQTKKGQGDESIKDYLKKLADYATIHFDYEERYFEKIKFPFIERQKMEHLEFKKKVIELIRNYQIKKNRLNVDILDFLKNWITSHILEEDLKARDFINKSIEVHEKEFSGISYKLSGNGRENIMFIHDNIHSSAFFNDILHIYQKKFKVLTIDLPGHGKSLDTRDNSEDFFMYSAEIINNICNSLNFTSTYVISYGTASHIVLNAASMKDNFFRKIFLCNPSPHVFEKEDIKMLMKERAKCRIAPNSFFYSRMHGDNWEKVIENDNKRFNTLKDNKKILFSGNPANIKCPVLSFYSMKNSDFSKISLFSNLSEKISDSRIIIENYSEDLLFLTSPQKFAFEIEKYL